MSGPPKRTAIVRITNKRGLHARASAKIVEAAARFQSEIVVTKDGQ
jgi:phosphocarrier protein